MEKYIDTIKEYAQKLAAAGCPMAEDDLVFHTLRGLPKAFNGFKTAVRTSFSGHSELRTLVLCKVNLKNMPYMTPGASSSVQGFSGTHGLTDAYAPQFMVPGSSSSSSGNSVFPQSENYASLAATSQPWCCNMAKSHKLVIPLSVSQATDLVGNHRAMELVLVSAEGACGNTSVANQESTDKFYEYPNKGFPDNSLSVASTSTAGHASSCLNNCSCTAYSYYSKGCSIWIGELVNLQQLLPNDGTGRTLYLRLAASEFPKVVEGGDMFSLLDHRLVKNADEEELRTKEDS
ncbi:hypothetical protein RHGRI_025767 [Rhododendron griersonianum]|uniref:Apple domain-containing protein n=1 Tax=Rhododendron griersonianum TaxID=479676 RepID=A0AAV6IQF7_9ERIC|nr:hypothetical protein RHGRI_025767 [Rhododendron griersonianum]